MYRTNYFFSISPNSQKALFEIKKWLNTAEYDLIKAEQAAEKNKEKISQLEINSMSNSHSVLIDLYESMRLISELQAGEQKNV